MPIIEYDLKQCKECGSTRFKKEKTFSVGKRDDRKNSSEQYKETNVRYDYKCVQCDAYIDKPI